MRTTRIFRTALLGLAGACAGTMSSGSAIPSSAAPGSLRAGLRTFVDSMIDDPEFRSAHWGVIIVDPARGETLYTRNADKLFMPASNMKLLTGTTALAQLGADYRWTTTVLAGGELQNGTLAGDIVVRGTGDPSISSSMHKGDALAPLRDMADSLRAHGITRITGHVNADASAFSDAALGYGWAWDDLDASYSAGVSALYFNEGFTEVVVHGGARAGDPVTATTRPAKSFPALIVTARTVAPLQRNATRADSQAVSAIRVSMDSSRGGILVAGTLAAGDSSAQEISFRNQTGAFMSAFVEALASRGIVVDGGVGEGTNRTMHEVFSWKSPPLRDVLPFFEKPSQNQIGEIFLKTLAREKTGVGRADSGSMIVSRQAVAWGAAPDGFAIHDGSGLSRHDYVTPRTIIHVLDAARSLPDFRLFYDALPIAGVDGTIRARMKGTPAQGNVHAKTGTLDKARSLSGYVTTADGHLLLFSALCNNYVVATRRVDRVTDALGVRLASMKLDPE